MLGLWPTAVEQAEVAADNAVGGDEGLPGHRPGDHAQGRRHRAHLDRALRARAPGDEVIALEDEAGQRYRKLVIADGRIVGAILLGYQEVALVRTAIAAAGTSADTSQELRTGRWGVLAGE